MKKPWLVCMLAVLGSADLHAQVWHTPSFQPPTVSDEIGFYFADIDDADWVVAAAWRQTGNLNLGLRGGLADVGERNNAMLAAEFFGGIGTAGRTLPLDLMWTLGGGATIGDGTLLSIPLGLSIGARLGDGTFLLVPYVHPRVSLDVSSFANVTETNLRFTADIGADAHVGRSAILRIGAALGDHDAVGIGIALPFGRSAVVR